VAQQLLLPIKPASPNVYEQRAAGSLQAIFKAHFQEFARQYDQRYAKIYGRFRLPHITEVVERFLECGDYTKGVARIQCTNPACKEEYFRPFSCKTFYFCPSCSQKRTLLFSEYMNEQLLLRLPHRQFVWTFPKLLRPFFRHDRRLFGELSPLIFNMLQDFYDEAAGKKIDTGAVLAYQTAGDFLRWNPHFHGLVLEGGFDKQGRFVHIPLGSLEKMTECFRKTVIRFFAEKKLINERLAENLLSWRHSGFSIDNGVRIPASSEKTRQALSQYISRPPLSLSKILFEQFSGIVLYHSSYNDYFKRNQQLFSVQDFIAQLTQHVPLKGLRYIRRYGLYSSRTRGKWLSKPHVLRLAPAGWKNTHPDSCGTPESMAPPDTDFGPWAKESQAAWARLLAKIFHVDPLRCRKCGSEMRVLAVITDPDEVRKILKHLIKIGRSPPGLDPLSLN